LHIISGGGDGAIASVGRGVEDGLLHGLREGEVVEEESDDGLEELVVGLGERGLALVREESHVGRLRFDIVDV